MDGPMLFFGALIIRIPLYNEDQMYSLIDNMLLQVHILGTGMVGQAVSSMEHRWIFSNQNVPQDDNDIHCQFSYGIKTIALIPLDMKGIVQFGSTQMICETTEFVNQAKQLLWLIDGFDPLENIVSPSSSHDFDEVFASLMACTDFQFEDPCGSDDLPELFDLVPNDLQLTYSSHQENTLPLDENHPFGFISSSNDPFPETGINNLINAPINNQEFSEQRSIMDSFCSLPNGGFSNDIFDGLELSFPEQNKGLLSDTVMPMNVENCLDFLSNERIDSMLSNEEKEFFSFGISSCNTTMDVGSSGSYPKKSKEECSRNVNKIGKPGPRPKPKDRIQIRERIAELRKLVPNGGKISIDSLLSQTVKHMLFLEGVTKYAETLRLVQEQRDIGVFSCEGQSTTERVYVKVINPPGQILIEMHLDETDFFADIVEMIHGFGLIILKGNMETRGNKLWACFIVEAEATRHVTKQHLYVSLHRFLDQKASGNCMNVAGQYIYNVSMKGILL
ncbi:transcription factor bHLH155-like isoform X2 [Impatiens glandulifera]|uniref:transcription factor bHLH155-like isoform X2 n=1 Tax=Impatiens glandulifera TaxID=253017 RepID=UPI001FB12272|nr:transcription factor bHLH155-like isoform X2 [Impatiens glandulifera]